MKSKKNGWDIRKKPNRKTDVMLVNKHALTHTQTHH